MITGGKEFSKGNLGRRKTHPPPKRNPSQGKRRTPRSGRHGTPGCSGRAESGTVPDLRPRHGLVGRLSGRAGPRSTGNPACRAGPRPMRKREQPERRGMGGSAGDGSGRRPPASLPLALDLASGRSSGLARSLLQPA